MFVSIDMDNLEFVHKHKDQFIVSGLAWLELCNHSHMVANTEQEMFLSKLTAFELCLLYRNTTGLDVTGTPHLVVREMLATLAEEKLTPTWAHLHEIDAQIALVEEDLHKGIPWKYVVGSKRPTQEFELFGLRCKALDGEEAIAAATRAPQRRKPRAATQAAATTNSAPQRPYAAKQRMSSVRPRIWAVADEMWEAAGKPRDKNVVLELRKEMMAKLETEHSIKRTSSSNELGNWMKDRLT